MEEALRFNGKKYTPVDFIEYKYESDEDGNILFLLKSECSSYGSRVAGKPVRTKLSNLLKMGGNGVIIIDLSDIPLMSSSFADEAFGKLFLEAGPIAFMQRFKFVNVMSTVQLLIDRAIAQRMSAGVAD